MGARQTKFESAPFPQSTQYQKSKQVDAIEEDNTIIDPRSPVSGCRTPINLPSQRVEKIAQLVPVENDKTTSENPLDILRKRFFKGFYNMNDPRSPSLNLNRTPLIFEDSYERTLNLDDTFADLFVGSNIPAQMEESKLCNDFEMAECIKTTPTLANEMEGMPITPIALQQQFDPRSPSIGVERTPIIFNDDDNDANEDVILENILATLTLNLDESGSSCVASLKSADIHINGEEKKDIVHKPTNRHLDRIRVGKKIIQKGPHRRQKRVRQKIYEDRENQPSTPQLKTRNADRIDSPKSKRTPLSCVRNSAQVRSRSVESSARPMKTRLPLISFDDTYNPNENKKASNLRVMREVTQDSLFM